MVTLMRDLAGRGPTKARTTIGRDHVLVILHDVLTPAGRTVVEAGHEDKVWDMRQVIQQAMRGRATRLIEETLQRQVISFMSANHFNPDMAAEIFALAPPEDGQGTVQEAEARDNES